MYSMLILTKLYLNFYFLKKLEFLRPAGSHNTGVSLALAPFIRLPHKLYMTPEKKPLNPTRSGLVIIFVVNYCG